MGKQQKTMWTIDGEQSIGPLSSYALAMWGIQGLLYPNDLLMDQNRQQQRASLIKGLKNFMRNSDQSPRTRVWAIAGRKGGVGKSIVCSLIGAALAREHRVVIVDVNLSCPIQPSIFGVENEIHAYYESRDPADGKKIADFAVATGKNLRIISYQKGDLSDTMPSIMTKLKFIRSLRDLDADYVLLDLGSRIDESGLDYFASSDANIVISTPELPSIQNISTFLKKLFKRKLDTVIFSLLENGDAQGIDIRQTEKSVIEHATEHLKNLNLPYNVILNRAIKSFNVKVIFNMVTADSQVPSRVLANYISNELGIRIDVAGKIKYDPIVRTALREKNLSILQWQESPILKEVDSIVKKLTASPQNYGARAISRKANLKKFKEDMIVCGVKCNYWDECAFKSPGHPCPCKNMN